MNKKKQNACKGTIYKINNKTYCVGEKKSRKGRSKKIRLNNSKKAMNKLK